MCSWRIECCNSHDWSLSCKELVGESNAAEYLDKEVFWIFPDHEHMYAQRADGMRHLKLVGDSNAAEYLHKHVFCTFHDQKTHVSIEGRRHAPLDCSVFCFFMLHAYIYTHGDNAKQWACWL